MGPGKPGKSWNFIMAFSRSGKYWKKAMWNVIVIIVVIAIIVNIMMTWDMGTWRHRDM